MSVSNVSRETPPPPPEATEVFSDRLPSAVAYAGWLTGAGVDRGLIGPREVPRLWDRHLLNCAVVAERVPEGSRVVDVGSGAGLPGLVWAILRPDLSVCLMEPMLRRTRYLEEVVAALGLGDRVDVMRARATDAPISSGFDVVTARALAGLDRLVPWLAPLTSPGGLIIAMKGRLAAEEATTAVQVVGRVSDTMAAVETYGGNVLDQAATAVVIRVDHPRGAAGERTGRGR